MCKRFLFLGNLIPSSTVVNIFVLISVLVLSSCGGSKKQDEQKTLPKDSLIGGYAHDWGHEGVDLIFFFENGMVYSNFVGNGTYSVDEESQQVIVRNKNGNEAKFTYYGSYIINEYNNSLDKMESEYANKKLREWVGERKYKQIMSHK